MKTIERTFYEMCEEIDDLKEQVEYWKQKYRNELNERVQEVNERIKESEGAVINSLMFALSVHDDENGNLVIDKDSRKQLAKNWIK